MGLSLSRREFFFKIDEFFDLGQEPAVDLGELEDFFDGESGAHGVADEENAFGIGDGKFGGDDVAREDGAVAKELCADAPGFAVAAQSGASDFEGAQGFLERFFEGAPNGHGFARGIHLGVERGIGLGEFFEGETGNFGDDVVDGRLETGGIYIKKIEKRLDARPPISIKNKFSSMKFE